MRKKELNESVQATFKNGEIKTYDSIKEAAEGTGLSENSIKARCNKPGSGSKSKDGITFIWADEHTRKAKQAKRSKAKGNKYELDVIKELTLLGFKGLKSSRSESRNLDNAKIDIAETEDHLSCYIQCKATANTPNIEAITEECPLKDRPLVIMWKKQKINEKQPEYVLLPKEYFYKLLEAYEKDNN